MQITPNCERKCRQNNSGWHDWFAWHPVCVDDVRLKFVWLETVERRFAGQAVADQVILGKYRERGIGTKVVSGSFESASRDVYAILYRRKSNQQEGSDENIE